MAPISLELASVPDGLSKLPDVSITELGPESPTLEPFPSLMVPKLSTIRDQSNLTMAQRPNLGRSTSVAFEGQGTVHDFLRMLKNERFRHMPHDGSNWDRILRWADNTAGVVLLSIGILRDFMLNSEDATRLICDSCSSLIQLGSTYTKTLLKAFSQFHKIALSLSVFLRQFHATNSTSDVRRELAHAFQQFAHITRDVNVYCVTRCRDVKLTDFTRLDAFIVESSKAFYRHLGSVSMAMWASNKRCSRFNVREIRDFLSPQDSVVKIIMSNQLYSESRRAEYTCEWFATPLRKFIRNGKKVMLVSGAASTGKSVLSRWIHEKLQESVDDDPFDIITYSVDPSMRYTSSPLSLIKSLLLQLLDRQIGSEKLLSHTNEAIKLAHSGCSSAEVEASLWTALESSLDDRKLLILVDGLDQLNSARIGNPLVLETLDRITKAKHNLKAIVLGRPVNEVASKHCQEHVSLEKIHDQDVSDIQHFIEDFIQHRSELHHLKEADRMEIVQKYSEAVRGSFLLADLQLCHIRHKKSAAEILKAIKPPRTVDELIDRQIAILDTDHRDTKHLLTWIVAAERPLTLQEVKALLEVDLDGCAYRPFSGDVEQSVRHHCGSLVVVRDGLVRLRHPSIRERLVSNKSSKLFIDLKQAHYELSVRTMAYFKIHIQQGDFDPSTSLCNTSDISANVAKYGLFEYAVRYWVLHFRSSSMCDKSTVKPNLPNSFKVAFSNTVRLALYEGSCLARQYIACEAERLQNLAYSVRKTMLGERSAAVLQSLVLKLRLGKKFESTAVLCEDAFNAFKMSRHMCSGHVVQEVAEMFVEYSLSLSTAERSKFHSRREEVTEYLVEVHRHSHNEIREMFYLRILAELHVEAHQIEKAITVHQQLYRLRVRISGHLHEDTRSVFQLLVMYLKQTSRRDEILELHLEYHHYVEESLVITEQRRIDSTLALITIYEDRNEIFRAEQVLVRYWKSLSASKLTTQTTELKVDFALHYTKFLLRHSRKEESEVILRGIWTEIQTYSYESRYESTMIKRVEKIAKYFSRLEVFSMSRSIYQSLYEHYERHEQRTSVECITIVRSLAETITRSISYSKKVSSSESTTVSSSTTAISKEEKTLTEIFEMCMESSAITSTTISICKALCSSYVFEERYEEACEIYRRVVCKVWTNIESMVVIDVTEITEHLTEEIIELSFSLAVCYFKMLRVDIAETIYLNLFYALISTRYIENKHFLLAKIKLVLEFFKTTYKYEHVVEIYRELFVWMPICFGKTHSETITVLVEFSQICFRMSLYEEAATACFYVYSCFRIAHGCLKYEGFQAAYLLCQIYELQHKFDLAYEVYSHLWRTFVRFGNEYKLDIAIIEKIHMRYMFIMEHHHQVEYSVILQTSKEYYESCVSFYSHKHDLTIKAAMQYAYVCEQREEHRETSIQLYQSVIKHCKEVKTEFTRKTLQTCNLRTARMYASTTKEITKAITIYKEHFESFSKTERTSVERITALQSLVVTYKRQDTKESMSSAIETLKSSVMDIVNHESYSEKLIESAHSIAKIYKECKFSNQAETLIAEMRSKVVEEIRSSVFSSSKVEQKSYIFLASFQQAISESSSFISVMSELREEVLMYESYFEATKIITDYRSIIKRGSILYFHLEKQTSRHSEFIKIQKEFTEYFNKYLGLSSTVREGVMHFFFQLYLRQISKTHYEHEVVRQATETVLRFTKTTKFAEAHDLVILIDKFIHLHGGFHSEFYIRTGFSLAMYLVGVGTNKCSDEKLRSSMLDLSRVIMQEALEHLDETDIEISELQQLLADLVTTLSEQKRYKDLERILLLLWKTRTIYNNLSSSPLVLYIGRSLVQTQACLNKLTDAIHICYQIRYNLSYIRGALDASTISFTLLLSSLYIAQSRYRDALDLHEDILSRLADGQTAPGLDAVHVAHTNVQLLELAYKRHGKLEKSTAHYCDLLSGLDERFSGDKTWSEKRPVLEKWTPGVKDGEMRGCWVAPARFEWCAAEEEEESVGETKWREELVKRRVSGSLWRLMGQMQSENGLVKGSGNGVLSGAGNE